jgi:hypothetical protein
LRTPQLLVLEAGTFSLEYGDWENQIEQAAKSAALAAGFRNVSSVIDTNQFARDVTIKRGPLTEYLPSTEARMTNFALGSERPLNLGEICDLLTDHLGVKLSMPDGQEMEIHVYE